MYLIDKLLSAERKQLTALLIGITSIRPLTTGPTTNRPPDVWPLDNSFPGISRGSEGLLQVRD